MNNTDIEVCIHDISNNFNFADRVKIPKAFWHHLDHNLFKTNNLSLSNKSISGHPDISVNIYALKNGFNLMFLRHCLAAQREEVRIDASIKSSITSKIIITIIDIINSEGSIKSIEFQLEMFAKSFEPV